MMEHYWWLFPLIMMAFCFLMMSRRRGPMMCGFDMRRKAGGSGFDHSDSAAEILDKRYALGELSREEYEEKKGTLRVETAN